MWPAVWMRARASGFASRRCSMRGRRAAQSFLQSHTTNLIRQITEDQRQVIRDVLAPLRNPLGPDPMLTGDTPQKLALDLVGG
jgi:hypothetical protein